MDSAEQRQGEKRVMDLLIRPLLDRGLGRPRNFAKKADFDAVVEKVLCPKLAYMTPDNLKALEFQIAAHPDGKAKDQLPIPNVILQEAADIQPPGDEASPLLLAVFAAQLGFDALANDWAPELRWFLKKERRWPKSQNVDDIKRKAHEARSKVADIRTRSDQGGVVSDHDLRWVEAREKAARICEEIRALTMGDRT